MNRFDVCIIAAGEGSRLREEGIEISKPLITINGETMIERLFHVLEEYNPAAVYCIINEESLDLKSSLEQYDFKFPFNLTVKSTESSFHSFYELSKYVKSEHFLLATTDSIFDKNEFKDFVKTYFEQNNNIDALMSVTGYVDDEKPLCVELNKENKIMSFSDRSEGCKLATGGIYFFNKSILDEMEYAVQQNTNRLRNFLKLLLNKGYSLSAYKFNKIIDVDHAGDIKKAEEFLSESK